MQNAKLKYWISCLPACLIAICLHAEDLSQILEPDKVLSFADFLYEQKDYDRAITEYQRYLYLTPSSPERNNIEFKIGICYQKSGRYNKAIEIFTKANATFEIGKTYFLAGDFEKAILSLEKCQDDTSKLTTGWAYLKQKKWDEASLSFKECNLSLCKELVGDAERGKKIRYKSPILAGLLSTVIPGSGRAYSNRMGDGLFSFFLIVGSASVAYSYYEEDKKLPAYGLGIFSLLLYVGDIYGSVISAKLFNKHTRQKYVNEVEKRYNLKEILNAEF